MDSAGRWFMFNRILVAMDDSADSDHVFEEAQSIAKMTDARLMLMHVLSATEVECVNVYERSLERSRDRLNDHTEQWESARQHGLEVLRSRHSAMCNAGISADIGLPAGNPGHQICEMAHRWGADLILLGRRGLTEQADYLLTSVSNYVLQHAPCAVLVLPNSVKLPSARSQFNAQPVTGS
jgi:nucleotide-binding universal stress UspA family protein